VQRHTCHCLRSTHYVCVVGCTQLGKEVEQTQWLEKIEECLQHRQQQQAKLSVETHCYW